MSPKEMNNIGCTCSLMAAGDCSGLCQLPEWEMGESAAYETEAGLPDWLNQVVEDVGPMFEDAPAGAPEPFNVAAFQMTDTVKVALDRDWDGFTMVVFVDELGYYPIYEWKRIPYIVVDKLVRWAVYFDMVDFGYVKPVTAQEVQGVLNLLAGDPEEEN